MMSEKSPLNPYAKPYAPLSKTQPETHTKDALECFNNTAEKVDTHHSSYSEEFLEYNISESEEPDVTTAEECGDLEDRETMMRTLASMFPGLSKESLADILDVNHGDMIETISMLDELEYGGEGYADLPEALEKRNVSDPIPQEASSSGASGTS